MPRLRLAFLGTPDFTVQSLDAMVASGHDIVCVYTQPPRPKGRGQQVQKTAVHLYAEEKNIEVRTPANFKDPADVDAFAALNLDAAVVAGYGMILPKTILHAPRHGCINIHPSLLPRWRGVAPVQFAILHGDEKSGVCVMKLDEKMDNGPIIAREEFALSPRETTESLNAKVWPLGATMLAKALGVLAESGKIDALPQDAEGATYTRFLTKEDGRIQWSDTAEEIDRRVRALNPWPGTWCLMDSGQRLKILETALLSGTSTDKAGTFNIDDASVVCGSGTLLKILSFQPESKTPITVESAARAGIVTDKTTLL